MKFILLLAAFCFYTANACVSVPADCLKAFTAKALSATNVYRARHQVPALTLITNATQTKVSQDYACKLADTYVFQHNSNRGPVGENLYLSMNSVPFSLTVANCEKFAQQAIDSWYNEVKSYDYTTGKSKDGGVTGHFTQLVWKSSTQVSFGLSASTGKDSKNWYWLPVVANYAPPGNYIGQETKNIFPPK